MCENIWIFLNGNASWYYKFIVLNNLENDDIMRLIEGDNSKFNEFKKYKPLDMNDYISIKENIPDLLKILSIESERQLRINVTKFIKTLSKEKPKIENTERIKDIVSIIKTFIELLGNDLMKELIEEIGNSLNMNWYIFELRKKLGM